MGPLILVAHFLAIHPETGKSIAEAMLRAPATVPSQEQASFADLANGILKCYHPTARYQNADIVQAPWARQGQYNANGSALVSIRYTGITNQRYEMQVAILQQDRLVRGAVQADTARVPYNGLCALEQWTMAQ